MKKFIHDWSQQHILLLGAQGGVGQALASQLTQCGANLTLVGRRAAELERQATQLGQEFLVCDLAAPEASQQLKSYCQQTSRPVTGLLNSAGISVTNAFAEATWEQHARLLQLNLVRPIELTHALLPILRRNPASWVMHVGSVFGAIGFPTQATYGASKAGLARFCEALQRELEDADVRIMHCAPRAIKTDFNQGVMASFNERSKTAEDSPEQVAALIIKQIEAGHYRRVIGWPERFFVKLNALFPQLVDNSMRKPRRLLRQLLQENKS